MTNTKPPEPIRVSAVIGKPPELRRRRGAVRRNAKRIHQKWQLCARYWRKRIDELPAHDRRNAAAAQHALGLPPSGLYA